MNSPREPAGTEEHEDADGGGRNKGNRQDNVEKVITRAKRKIEKDTVIPPERYTEIRKMAERKEWQGLSTACTQVMGEMETHLSKKARYKRALQMRKNLKVRKERFGDPDKKMPKLVINSIMQRH